MFCASGTPGDPTCPINHVDLGTAIPLSLSYVARPMDPMIEISGFVLNGGASRVDGVVMEHWCLDCAQPLETKLVATSLAIGATAPTFSLRFAQGEMLQLRFDAIR